MRYQQAESSATTDYLTGLPNARSLFLHLDGELARCRRLNSPLVVLVCDLNGFKQVNDKYGHLEGNRVLHTVAKKLKESLPRIRLRGAHGRRRIRAGAAGPAHGSAAAKDRSA